MSRTRALPSVLLSGPDGRLDPGWAFRTDPFAFTPHADGQLPGGGGIRAFPDQFLNVNMSLPSVRSETLNRDRASD